MIKARFQIDDGEIYDTYDRYGMIYVSSDNIINAPSKQFEKTTYIEEQGEHIDHRSVADAFDYKVKFLIKPNRPEFGFGRNPNLAYGTANAKTIVVPNDQVWYKKLYKFDMSQLRVGDEITVSFDVNFENITTQTGNDLSLNLQTMSFGFFESVWIVKHGKGHISKTVKIKRADQLGGLYLQSNNVSTLPLNFIYIANLKIEVGNKETPYTQNPSEYPTVNSLVSAFNADIRTEDTEGIVTYKQIAFYNDFKRVKIVGYAQPISNLSLFWRDDNDSLGDVAEAELTIRVSDPSLCDFNINNIPPEFTAINDPIYAE